jgi:hypothetical protein
MGADRLLLGPAENGLLLSHSRDGGSMSYLDGQVRSACRLASDIARGGRVQPAVHLLLGLFAGVAVTFLN